MWLSGGTVPPDNSLSRGTVKGVPPDNLLSGGTVSRGSLRIICYPEGPCQEVLRNHTSCLTILKGDTTLLVIPLTQPSKKVEIFKDNTHITTWMMRSTIIGVWCVTLETLMMTIGCPACHSLLATVGFHATETYLQGETLLDIRKILWAPPS